MQITHERAHQLIQLNMDQVLSPPDAAGLSAHLRDCMNCQAYANEIREVEHLLLPALKKKWSHRLIPLSIPALTEKNLKSRTSSFVATRKAAIGLMVVTLFFGIWQIVFYGAGASDQKPIIVLPVPTPSSQTAPATRITVTLEDCKIIRYRVQGDETLTAIAAQFSVSEEEIMAINSLKSKAISPSMELIIPICNFTPTGTVAPVTFTTTYTPIIKPTTSTPGG